MKSIIFITLILIGAAFSLECLFITSSTGLTLTSYVPNHYNQPEIQYGDSYFNNRVYEHSVLINGTYFVGVANSFTYYDVVDMPKFIGTTIEIISIPYVFSSLTPNPFDPNGLLVVTSSGSLISVNMFNLQPDGNVNITLTPISGNSNFQNGQMTTSGNLAYFVVIAYQSPMQSLMDTSSEICQNEICVYLYTFDLYAGVVNNVAQVETSFDPNSILAGFGGGVLNFVSRDHMSIFYVDPSTGLIKISAEITQLQSVYSATILGSNVFIIGGATSTNATSLYYTTSSSTPSFQTLQGPDDQTGISNFGNC